MSLESLALYNGNYMKGKFAAFFPYLQKPSGRVSFKIVRNRQVASLRTGSAEARMLFREFPDERPVHDHPRSQTRQRVRLEIGPTGGQQHT
jgi:hypothetical protein